jgi:predicted dehydrogenase
MPDRLAPGVALVGTSGHGLWHRRVLHRLVQAGRLRLVGLCDVRPIEPAEDAPVEGVPCYPDHRTMLAQQRPDVVIVCTPPHTHLPIALDVLGSGADLLLEKPPVRSLAEHEQLRIALSTTGRACQIGFQALGSAAYTRLATQLRQGLLGPVTAITALGAWWRPDGYWRRVPWAGRRMLAGQPVLDGALANPFAHAIMQCLALADELGAGGPGPARIELERYHSREIEVDDTACLRLTLHSGLRILVAVTLAAQPFVPGEITVFGERGTAALEYPTDRLRLPGDTGWGPPVPGRIGLLENLLEHRADPRTAVLVPLDRTAAFTAVVEAIARAPAPAPIPARFLAPHPDGSGMVVPGVADVLRSATQRLALPSEMSVPWAAPSPVTAAIDWRSDAQTEPA